jgi:hypothetical protein
MYHLVPTPESFEIIVNREFDFFFVFQRINYVIVGLLNARLRASCYDFKYQVHLPILILEIRLKDIRVGQRKKSEVKKIK